MTPMNVDCKMLFSHTIFLVATRQNPSFFIGSVFVRLPTCQKAWRRERRNKGKCNAFVQGFF
jgi:hypothetical protein